MKIIALAILVFFSLIPISSFANNKDSRGAIYDLNGSILTITETSFRQIDRLNNGEHASAIIKGRIPAISIKEAIEKIQASHDLFQERSVMLSPTSNLLIEFDGRIANLLMTHICRGENGNYLAVSIPDIYFTENLSVNISGQEKIIKQLIIGTDPSTGLLLQKKLLWGSVTEYWRFLLKQMDYDKKFKIQGLVNYAEQRSENNEIEKLELTIIIIKISPLP